MHPEVRHELGTMLPDTLAFPWFAEREAAWLLSRHVRALVRLSELRRGPLGRLLACAGLREIASASGDAWMTPERLLPLADPLAVLSGERALADDRVAELALDLACTADWQKYEVSFGRWPDDSELDDWRDLQVSRSGSNLVLQVNFPERFVGKFDRVFGRTNRCLFEWFDHPVRNDGRGMTMACARLDWELWGENLLIEEVQTDWLRNLRSHLGGRDMRTPKWQHAEQQSLLRRAAATHGRHWQRAVMLAVLVFAVRELGVRRVWMHQTATGVRLKHIEDEHPPRSVYTDLPRRFGFHPTDRAPAVLYSARSEALARLRRSGQPLFWRAKLAPEAAAIQP